MRHVDLNIGGFIPLTTIDYPDHLAAVVFCQGCPLKCVYCYNKKLACKKTNNKYSWASIKQFLQTRKNLLEAVVFSGGEPTLQFSIIKAAQEVKAFGFKVGLHTSGIYPNRLQRLLPYVDWVGMDIKAPLEDYQSITKVPNSGKGALLSMQILLDSKVDYEFRTTVYKPIINQAKIDKIYNLLANMGVAQDKLKLQPYQNI